MSKTPTRVISQVQNINFKKSKMDKIKSPINKLNNNSIFNKKNKFGKLNIGNSNIKSGRTKKHQKAQSTGNYEISNLLSKSKMIKNISQNQKIMNQNTEVTNKPRLPFSFAQKNQTIDSNTNQSNKIKSISKDLEGLTEDDNLSGFNIEMNKKNIIIDNIDGSLKEKTDGSLNFTKSFKTNQSNLKSLK